MNQAPKVEQVYTAPTLLPPLVRFMVAAVWAAAVFWGCGFVYLIVPSRDLVAGLLFRLLACALTAAGFAFFVRVLDFSSAPLLPSLGLPSDSVARRQFSAGLALGGLLITAAVLFIAACGGLQLHHHHGHRMWLRALIVAALLFFGAVMEELSFRGYPFQKLTQAFGAFWAVIALSALFGVVHLWNPDSPGLLSWGFANTLVVGALFALARIRTGSLWFSIGLHFGWNFFQGAVFGLSVSGLREFASYITGTIHGRAALTGGAYGIEASATCTIVLIIAFPLLWWLTAPRSLQHQPPSSPPADGI